MSEPQDPKKDDLALDEPVIKDETPPPAAEAPPTAEPDTPEGPEPDASKASAPETPEPEASKASEPETPEPEASKASEPETPEPEASKASEPEAPKPSADLKRTETKPKPEQSGPSPEKAKEEKTKAETANLPQAIEKKPPINIKAWLKATRPSYYVATLVPLFLGYFAAVGYGETHRPGLFVLILIACFLVHLAANLANDLFEHAQGIDTTDSIGGSRVIQEGQISPGQLKKAIGICYLAAFVLAIFICRGNEALWVMVVFAAFSSFFYVCPPIKYGHRGLGEVFVFINMGLIMTVGTYMALTGLFELKLVSLALPVALGVAGILFFQSLPEIEDDAKVGKKTLAVKLGREKSTLAQSLWWPLIWVLMINLWFSGFVAWPALLCVFTLPLHLIVTRRIRLTTDWRKLDKYGLIVKLMYLLNGLFLILGVHVITVNGEIAKGLENRQTITTSAPTRQAPEVVPKAAATAPEGEAAQPADQAQPEATSAPSPEPEAAQPAESETEPPAGEPTAQPTESTPPAEPTEPAPPAAPAEPEPAAPTESETALPAAPAEP
ncbi:MAG: UbiA family prenyltransferase, partial [Deltaproteobacteria bacterium]|nr:UbiA family prenyltransferase [Deltaproteobacteria bacterium]